MHRTFAAALGLAAILGSAVPAWADDLAAQLDRVAPHVNAQDTAALGGPEDAAGILAGLEGQWFGLNNLVRNWGEAGVGFGPDSLASSRDRSCSEAADATLVYEVTGATSLAVHETLRTYDAELTQTLSQVEGRRFAVSLDEEALLRSYGLEDADPARQEEIREVARLLAEEGVELWRPTDDLLVVSGPFGIDVTGRCPAPH